jgi:hypothetical protein
MNQIKLLLSEIIHKQNIMSLFSVFPDDHKKILTSIQQNGCYVIEDFLESEVCSKLLLEADKFLKDNPALISSESNDSDSRVYQIDKYSSKFNIEKVDLLADSLFKMFSFIFKKSYFMLLGKIISNGNNLGSGGGWHRDSPFTHQFKTILYLTDVDESTGPFQYIKGSHSFSSIKKSCKFLGKNINERRFSNEEVELLKKNNVVGEVITVTGKAGTLLIADTRGLHRGKPLEKGHRYALTRYHFSKKIDSKFSI